MGLGQRDLQDLTAENIILRLVLASGWTALLGVALFLASLVVPSPSNRLLEIVGTATLTLGLAHLVSDFSLRNSVSRQILAAVGLSSDLSKSGIEHIGRFRQIDWAGFFANNRGDVQICFRTGQQWTSDNATLVLEEAANHKTKVTVTLMDPDAPQPFMETYAAAFKTRGGASGLRQQLRDTIDEWQSAAERVARDTVKQIHLTIACSQAILPYSFYCSGDRMWLIMSPAQQRRTPWKLPALLCRATGREEDGIYEWVLRDIAECREQKLIHDWKPPATQAAARAPFPTAAGGSVAPNEGGASAEAGGESTKDLPKS